MKSVVSLGYNNREVIPMDIDKILEEIRKLSHEDLQKFHEQYLDLIEAKGWLKLTEESLGKGWDDKDDYSEYVGS